MGEGSRRTVYETGRGRICPGCGWPVDDCRCSKREQQPLPQKLSAVLRLERKGRAGKTVTVVGGLPHNDAFLKELAGALKRACGSGGTIAEGAVEIQGDHRDRLREVLRARGFSVRGG